MSNPYESPSPSPTSRSQAAQAQVNAPAIALMVISVLAIGIGLLGLAGNVFLLLSGAVAHLEANNDGPISEYTTITVRSIWGALLVAASGFILYGAIQMKGLTNFTAARTAAVIAVIPCIGPCCLLGIPFGIWALVVLAKPEVRDAFD
ncbi:hypothetical protein [Bremerella alba]|uniref:DUF4064 domain-containing protein n=1 Tax=Bremerella alba TaxID=980252 RepID=A0A7V9A8S9_9BACT|nr:hypothetical protein [Bremerella alba]MBA2116603.1 hypothetical protein [Bremerella alba]